MSMLRSLRERKGLTISQLAAKASISSRVIIEYEEGRQAISLPHAKLLAKALWVGIEDLMPPAGVAPLPPVVSTQSAVSRLATPTPVPHTAPPPPPPRPPAASSPTTSTSTMAAPPAYRPAPDPAPVTPRYEGARTVRPVSSDGRGGAPAQAGAAGAKTTRPNRPAPPPPGPITEGQLEELRRLAVKLEITEEQLEDRIGKKLSEMNRPDAKEWIKRARGMAEEIAPSRKIPYGQWPESREDQEAAYLKSQQDAGSFFIFKLFNGEQFEGTIADFTPYTITIKQHGSGDEMVLRKLAVAYYRRTEAPAEPAAKSTTEKKTRAQAKERHQPIDTGLDSDRAGEPAKPETDSMDEDRGV